MIKQDILKTYSLTSGGKLRRIFECYRTPGLHAVITYRFGAWLLSQSWPVRLLLKPLYAFQHHRMKSKWGIEISPEARIGEGFNLFHFGGVFIGSVIIGNNFSVSHDVTIGLSGEGSRRGAPVIGNNVYIAPGANVSGKITIGNNVKIGANAVVDRNVPNDALVQVRPAQVVRFPGLYASGNSSSIGKEDGTAQDDSGNEKLPG